MVSAIESQGDNHIGRLEGFRSLWPENQEIHFLKGQRGYRSPKIDNSTVREKGVMRSVESTTAKKVQAKGSLRKRAY